MSTVKTPLRYPGGKQKIWHFIAEIIKKNGLEFGHYVEPYAGGAGVAMELLLNEIVSYIHLNDSCPAVFSFWHSVINEPEDLCRRIRCASLTVEEWTRQKNIYTHPQDYSQVELGFAMFYLNRCNRSGIITGGVIGGKNQDGPWKMDARFSRNDLITRIERIALKKQFIKIRNWDARKFLLTYVPKLPGKTLVYCDPPYFNKADRLYANYYNLQDHIRLARTIQNDIRVKWLVSYDDAPPIIEQYELRRKFTYSLQYNAANAYRGSEVFIFCDELVIPTESKVQSINEALQTM